ncbi:MAG: DUF4258 domain-containing protein [Gammaproteobacteria bacterium]|nr:DUF4258 domain-containing protein [Gammaproteobacteria bacterium]
MSIAQFSHHAEVRMQQRGIPIDVVESLLDHGRRQHDKHGGQIVYFDNRCWARLERSGFRQRIANFDRYRKVYAVISSDQVVATVGHRYNRIKRH